jgi:hypothetical protein
MILLPIFVWAIMLLIIHGKAPQKRNKYARIWGRISVFLLTPPNNCARKGVDE